MPNQSSIIDAVRELAENNIFNIELGSIHRHEKKLLSLLKNMEYNFIIHNFFPASKERFILNIASINTDVRERSLEFIKGAVDFAERINAKLYTIHPGFLIDPVEESKSLEDYDFNFDTQRIDPSPSTYDRCSAHFLDSLNRIAAYIKDKKLKIAVETQGTVSKKDVMFFSKPSDFSLFFKENKNKNIGINLNLGHLNLAVNAWGLDMYEVIEMIKPHLFAVEVSHNSGLKDEHAALKPDGWYMDILKNDFFKKIPIIFEGRNLTIQEVISSHLLLKNTVLGGGLDV